MCVVARRNLRLSERLLQRLVRLTQLGQDIRIELVCLRLRDVALGHEALGELLARSRMVGDRSREDRLGVGGFVLLVVAMAPVADQVDHDVVAEAVPIGQREPNRSKRRLRVVGIDVNDRDVEALGEVA